MNSDDYYRGDYRMTTTEMTTAEMTTMAECQLLAEMDDLPFTDPNPRLPKVARELRVAEKRRSCRRSSFVRGRRSLALPLIDSAELCKTIDPSLPSDERVALLCGKAFQYAVEKLDAEFPDLDGVTEFKELGEKTFSKMHTEAIERRHAEETKTKDSCGGTASSRAPSVLEQYMQQLEKEASDWDNLLAMHNRMADEAERVAKGRPAVITGSSVTLSAKQQKFLSKRPDYNGSRQALQRRRERTFLETKVLVENTKLVARYLSDVSSVLKHQALSLHQHSFAGIKDFDDPKKLISNILDMPSVDN